MPCRRQHTRLAPETQSTIPRLGLPCGTHARNRHFHLNNTGSIHPLGKSQTQPMPHKQPCLHGLCLGQSCLSEDSLDRSEKHWQRRHTILRSHRPRTWQRRCEMHASYAPSERHPDGFDSPATWFALLIFPSEILSSARAIRPNKTCESSRSCSQASRRPCRGRDRSKARSSLSCRY